VGRALRFTDHAQCSEGVVVGKKGASSLDVCGDNVHFYVPAAYSPFILLIVILLMGFESVLDALVK
jgi:hypothetical protein